MVLARWWEHERTLRFLRSAAVGLAATVVDLLALTLLVEALRLPPTLANVPALLCGCSVQFLGNRHFVFAAGNGSIRRHVAGFALVETGVIVFNALLFHLLVTATKIPYPIARPIGQCLVYVCFSYPMWQLVFGQKIRATTKAPAAAPDDEA